MNKMYTRRALWSACFAVVSALGGCANVPGLNMGMGAAPAPTVTVASTRLSSAEREFAIRAAAQGIYEVEVSRLAAERAVSTGVRSYAQMMVSHHSEANNELISLMSAKGIAPPKGLAADKKAKLHRLASLPRSDAFDNGYVRVVGIEDHRANIAVFERARRETRDRDLLAWIDKSLFTLRNHLAAAQSLAGALAS